MSTPVRLERDRDIALIVIDHPPVNALSHAVRAALLEAVLEADGSATLSAIVIAGAGKHFVAGADIREFDAAPVAPILNEVLLRIENCRKPVVACIHGAALGGGLELALACHFRCATPDAKLGFPEVQLGLLPGSGGTQRLPRLIGVEAALEMMLGGESVDCAQALKLGIVDRVLEGGPHAESVRYARELVARKALRRVSDLSIDPASIAPDFFARQREKAARLANGHGSQGHIVHCVEAAVTLPFADGLALARRSFEERRVSVGSRALRHLFFAERGNRPAADAVAREIVRVAVVGAGTMGAGIAVSLAMAGVPVTLVDTQPAALAAGMTRVRETIEAAARKGRIAVDEAASMIASVGAASGYEELHDTQLAIEAVFESLSVKREVFRQLDAACPAGAILATNTSTLDVDAIAAATQRPQDVVGMHFFSPANIMRLVEIVRGAATSANALATALALAKRMRKLGVVVGNCFGFVGNRMLYAYGRENQLMLLEGASPAQIDAALKEFGMAMGPNAVGDLAGLDVGYRVRRERTDLPDDPRYYRIADLLVDAGRLGQKSGKGMFRYEPGSREPIVDLEVGQMIAAEAARLGVAQRELSKAEIIDRCILALINEGARILAEGIAETPADIDAIWCNGYGFPRWRGGPMFYADCLGAAHVRERIDTFKRQPGLEYWSPAPLLEELARHTRTFGEWAATRGEAA